jgi:hypothetical protein
MAGLTIVRPEGAPIAQPFHTAPRFGVFVVVAADGSLPVQLTSFSARHVTGTVVALRWLTLSETNNFGFQIQWSRSGQQRFNNVPGGFVQGSGTTTEPREYRFDHPSAVAGVNWYRLVQYDLDGDSMIFDPVSVDLPTSVSERAGLEYRLLPSHPNPFNPHTSFEFEVPELIDVEVSVYDQTGRLAGTLSSGLHAPGRYVVSWNASAMASGMYVVRMRAGSFAASHKILLVK